MKSHKPNLKFIAEFNYITMKGNELTSGPRMNKPLYDSGTGSSIIKNCKHSFKMLWVLQPAATQMWLSFAKNLEMKMPKFIINLQRDQISLRMRKV